MKYYFDNTNGLKNYLTDMEAVGITPSHGQWQYHHNDEFTWHRSEFLNKLNYYDPHAEITHDPADKDAVRLIEICSVGDVELLSRLLDRIELTKNTILYSSTEPFYNSPRIQERYNVKVISCASHLTEQPHKLAFTSYVLPFIVGQGLAQWDLPEPDVDRWFDADKHYLFLNLNNRFNYGRFVLLLHLYYHNLLSQGLVAFKYDHLIDIENLGKNTNVSGELQNILIYLENNPELWDAGNLLLKQKQPLALEELANHNIKLTNLAPPHNPKWYLRTWFSLVSECNQREHVNGQFMSEKIVKAMLHGHPFIVYGDAGQLPWLKRIGFDTFDWLFGDNIDNPAVVDNRTWLRTKLDNTVDLLKRSNAELFAKNKQQIKAAVLHNYRHLHSDNLRQQIVDDWQRIINYLVE